MQPSVGSIPGRTQLEPLDDLVSGKIVIIEQSLKHLYAEIEARQKIHDSLIEELDREHCRQMEALRQVAPHGSSPFTIGDPRRRSGIEKELATLENEKRHEQVAVWKDVGSLNRELRELMREFHEEKQRQRVIHG